MLHQKPTLEETRAAFRWDIPERYNIGADVCDKWAKADPHRTAIIDIVGGLPHPISFGALHDLTSQLAHALTERGIGPGDVVGVLLPQGLPCAAAHIAILRLGAITLPLFTRFGPDALDHRLRDSRAKLVLTDAGGEGLLARCDDLPDLEDHLRIDGPHLIHATEHHPVTFDTADTSAEDPAILIYTSGTTGLPKGALHAHRVLLGHLPGVEMSHDFLPQPDDRIWTPADWAWIGGLLDVLMPALHHGVTVVAWGDGGPFDPSAALDLMRDQKVRNAFLPPTALKLMRQVPDAADRGLNLRSVGSGGETLGEELIRWGQEVFGTTINEFYGQTECNMIVSSCAALEPAEPGVMGFPVPGHTVAVIDPATGARRTEGDEGEIAALTPDPVMFLGYLNRPEATADKFVTGPEGKWLLTGDRGILQPSGRIRFKGRGDDIISSAGYRIGPAEIEDCLLTHPAVQLAGVVGQPDDTRGEIVAAYVTLHPGHSPDDTLARDIAAHVKDRLAAHEYPRVVRFIDDMPMTTTGKIIRAELRARALQDKAREASVS